MMPAWNCETLPWSWVDCLPARPQAAEVDAQRGHVVYRGRNSRARKGTLLEACTARGACKGNATRGISCLLSNGCSAGAGEAILGLRCGGRWEVEGGKVWQTQPTFLNAGHGLVGIDG